MRMRLSTTWSAERDALGIGDGDAPESEPPRLGAVISPAKASRAVTVRIVSTTVISPNLSYSVKKLANRDTQSAAIDRRSRCDSVRDCPVPSSALLAGPTPRVGQRTACICFGVGFLVFMAVDDAANRTQKTVNLAR